MMNTTRPKIGWGILVCLALGTHRLGAAEEAQFTGTVFSSGGAANPAANAFDSNTNTYYEGAQNGSYVGQDMGYFAKGQITRIRFHPRPGYPSRMNGGKFQGGNDATNGVFTNLYTIPATPPTAWTEVPIADGTLYRFLRYAGPNGGYCNVAEIEFWGMTVNFPHIETETATQVTPLSATFNGHLVSTGASPTTVSVYGGPTDGGTNAGGWANTNVFDGFPSPGPISTNVPVAAGIEMFYRFAASNQEGWVWATNRAYFLSAPVTVSVAPATMTELNKTGTFWFSRASSLTSEAVTVHFTVGGTATLGSDYTLSHTSSITLAAGVSSAAVQAVSRPLFTHGDEDQTVMLTVTNGAYVSEPVSSATLTIIPLGGDMLTGTPFTLSATVNPAAHAFDGNTNTYHESANSFGWFANGGYVGLDLGSTTWARVTWIRFHPRPGYPSRMNGGKFQGGNDATNGVFTNLYTIPATPPTAWTAVPISDVTPYRYLRYLGPNGGYCNVAEIEFWGMALPVMIKPQGSIYIIF